MKITFHPMRQEAAERISGWKYEGIYEMYSFAGPEEDAAELMNGEYYSAHHEAGDLIGYLCHGQSARVPGGYHKGIYDQAGFTDIGLGMKPELTGKRLGVPFLREALKFLEQQWNTRQFRLVVAEFNERAVKVYERVGFAISMSFDSPVRGEPVRFISMKTDNGFTPGIVEDAAATDSERTEAVKP